jgi:CO/xanthine dehydrogenase FAD-binding subunit
VSTTAGTWLRPRDLAEALDALRAGATVIGGGAALASESFSPVIGGRVVDLAGLRVPGVLGETGLRGRDGRYAGAMTTLADLLADPGIADGWPGVRAAAAATATPEVRRVATIGGTVAARLPTSDLLPVLCAYGAAVDLADTGGHRRTVPVAAYLAAPATGIVVGVDLGGPAAGAFRRFAGRPGFAPAIASVAGVRRSRDALELWAGAAGPGPFRMGSAGLPDEATLRSDYAASAGYRRRLLGALRADVLAELAEASLTDRE